MCILNVSKVRYWPVPHKDTSIQTTFKRKWMLQFHPLVIQRGNEKFQFFWEGLHGNTRRKMIFTYFYCLNVPLVGPAKFRESIFIRNQTAHDRCAMVTSSASRIRIFNPACWRVGGWIFFSGHITTQFPPVGHRGHPKRLLWLVKGILPNILTWPYMALKFRLRIYNIVAQNFWWPKMCGSKFCPIWKTKSSKRARPEQKHGTTYFQKFFVGSFWWWFHVDVAIFVCW